MMKKTILTIASVLLSCVSSLSAQDIATRGAGVIEVNTQRFQQTLANSTSPIVLVVTAEWCGPCKNLKPIYNQIATEIPGVTFLRADYDSNPDLAKQYDVGSIPTILFIQPNGMVADRLVGLTSKQELQARIQALQSNRR